MPPRPSTGSMIDQPQSARSAVCGAAIIGDRAAAPAPCESGRVAQWESARFTRERSQVRNPPRPYIIHAPWGCSNSHGTIRGTKRRLAALPSRPRRASASAARPPRSGCSSFHCPYTARHPGLVASQPSHHPAQDAPREEAQRSSAASAPTRPIAPRARCARTARHRVRRGRRRHLLDVCEQLDPRIPRAPRRDRFVHGVSDRYDVPGPELRVEGQGPIENRVERIVAAFDAAAPRRP